MPRGHGASSAAQAPGRPRCATRYGSGRAAGWPGQLLTCSHYGRGQGQEAGEPEDAADARAGGQGHGGSRSSSSRRAHAGRYSAREVRAVRGGEDSALALPRFGTLCCCAQPAAPTLAHVSCSAPPPRTPSRALPLPIPSSSSQSSPLRPQSYSSNLPPCCAPLSLYFSSLRFLPPSSRHL